MEWLNPENVVALITAVVGVAAAVGPFWYERRVPRRKRIGYRVQMDTPIGGDAQGGHDTVRLGLFDDSPDMSNATLVLLRIENDGAQGISATDYTGPDTHGLTVHFTDRTVRGVAVTQPNPEHAHLMAHFTPEAGMRHHQNRVHLPKVPLNRGQHYKLLVLLGGGGVGSTVRVTGGIQDGAVMPNESTTPDDKPPLFSRPARALILALAVCVIALATLTVVRDDQAPPPMGCATGELTVTGSTAFTPVARELAEKYQAECPGSKITVDTHGSTAGIRALDEAGSATEDGSPPVIALSDGRKPNGYPQLRESRVAVSAFALVLNDRVPLKGLTTAQVRRLYAGTVRNWKELGGPDLPVRLVSRDANSGTRQVFQRRVLGTGEPANSSQDCAGRDDGRAGVIRCELDSTEQVLAKVASVPGALGYSELRSGSGAGPKGLHRLRLDGREPSIENIGTSGYPYHEIEYTYTYGSPPADSLVSSFLVYMTLGSGQDIIRTHGHLPCAAPEAAKPCAGG
ncbi:substrate-binding domain-containing protein [Streptomyces flavidovirens]|uniref:substrate-binding domain-containing protein n=1 Tax=Streptomyces flavidovirens TaxID=67298 RepID=UPI0034215C55